LIATAGLGPRAHDDLVRGPRADPEALAAFGWVSYNPGGDFLVRGGGKPAVVAFVGAEYAWDPAEEYEPVVVTRPAQRVRVSVLRMATVTFRQDENTASSVGATWDGPLPAERGFSRDGTRLLLESDEHRFWLWEVENDVVGQFRELKALRPELRLNALALLGDGTTALMHGPDRAIGVWDLQSGTELRRVEGLSALFRPFAITPDGDLLVAPTHGGVAAWDLRSGAKIRDVMTPAAGNGLLALSPDGEQVLVAGDDNTLGVYTLSNGGLVARLAGPSAQATAACFSQDGTKLAVAFGKEIRLWNLP
jgi:WD40 repeat protein